MAQQPGHGLRVGQPVLVRDAFNELKKAVVRTVPRDERDRTRSEVVTTHGLFPKTWVSVEGRPAVPWPVEDIFTDMDSAKEAQRVNA